MNILFITKLLPYPDDTGGKYKTYQILKLLAQSNNIHLISFIDSPLEKQIHHKINKLYQSIKLFKIPDKSYSYGSIFITFLKSLISRKPYIVQWYYSKEMEKYINLLANQIKFDLIYIDHNNMIQYIPKNYSGKTVYDEHNVSYLAFRNCYDFETNLIRKLFFFIESIRLELFEKKFIPKMSHIFTISKIDKNRLISIGCKSDKIDFLPVPFTHKYRFSSKKDKYSITFVGLLSWLPNEYSLKWFIDKILPIIERNIPNITLNIAGKYGDYIENYFSKIKDSHINYLGYLKNLNRLYKNTSLFIVPIVMGGGIRIKLLDALSHGLPIVSTSLGAEGIEITNGKHILIADEPDEFANSVIKILKSKVLANRLSKNGFNFIKRNHNFNKARQILYNINSI